MDEYKRRCPKLVELWEFELLHKRCMLTEGHIENEHLAKDSNGQLFWFGVE